jgi:hypothetical protein
VEDDFGEILAATKCWVFLMYSKSIGYVPYSEITGKLSILMVIITFQAFFLPHPDSIILPIRKL